MYPDPQRLEDITSVRDAMRQISQEASVAVELLDAKIEDEPWTVRQKPKMYAVSLSLYRSSALKLTRNLTLIRSVSLLTFSPHDRRAER